MAALIGDHKAQGADGIASAAAVQGARLRVFVYGSAPHGGGRLPPLRLCSSLPAPSPEGGSPAAWWSRAPSLPRHGALFAFLYQGIATIA